MNREELICMAEFCSSPDWPEWCSDEDALERFAALVAAAEREACVEAVRNEWTTGSKPTFLRDLEAAIRARGQA